MRLRPEAKLASLTTAACDPVASPRVLSIAVLDEGGRPAAANGSAEAKSPLFTAAVTRPPAPPPPAMDRRTRSSSSAGASARTPPVTKNPVDGFDDVFAFAARKRAGSCEADAASDAPIPGSALAGPPTTPSAKAPRFIATNARGPKLVAP